MKLCGYSDCMKESTAVRYGFNVCDEHTHNISNRLRDTFFSQKLSKMFDKGEMTNHSLGVTYIVELPIGSIKIGFSRNHETLALRLTSLSSQFLGMAHLIATVAAGETFEALLHHRFSEFRHWHVPAEQFLGVDEIYEYAEEVGLEANGILAKKKFEEDIWPRFSATRNEDLPLWVACPACNAVQDLECSWKVKPTGRFHKTRESRCREIYPSYVKSR